MLDPCSKTDPPGRQVEQLAADVGYSRFLFIATRIAHREQDVIQHFGRHIARAEIIGAWHRDVVAGKDRLIHALEVRDLRRPVDAGIAALVVRDVPGPFGVRAELAFQP